jgi:hypothetical protein
LFTSFQELLLLRFSLTQELLLALLWPGAVRPNCVRIQWPFNLLP